MKKSFFFLSFILLTLVNYNSLTAQTLNSDMWVTNGTVRTVVSDVVYTYIGGDFTLVGPNTGNGAKLTTASSAPDMSFPKVTGEIRTCVSDGSGGWYIGGSFTKVGNYTRNRLAQINSSGEVTAWDPNAGGPIMSIAISGSDIYVGGYFTTINGSTTRNNLAKLNNTTGVADAAWDPNVSSIVYSIAISGSDIYVGGLFTTINGSTARNNLAKLNNTTGAADGTWNPNANTTVYTIAVSDSDIYVGGDFTTINGTTARNRLAKLNNTTGNADATWNPNANVTVMSIAISGSDIYVGGGFTIINDATIRNRLVKLNNTTGAADALWDPNADGSIDAIAFSGSDIYVGGPFTTINGTTARNRLAKLNNTTGLADATWNPNSSNTIYSIAVSGSDIYVGGSFTIIGGQTRNRIARFNNTNGSLDGTWNPNASTAGSKVQSIALSGSDIYVGGSFTTIGGQTRNRLAKLNNTDGTADGTWNPNASTASSTVQSIAVSGSYIYVGGSFTKINGTTLTRNRLAKLNNTDGTADGTWNPNANLTVNYIALSDNDIYVGGSFTKINGTTLTRNRLVKLNSTTGAADATWDPNASAAVNSIAISGSDIYVGGAFTTINGSTTRNYLAKLNNTTGVADATWNPNASAAVNSIGMSGSDFYVGGAFTTIGGGAQPYFAKFVICASPVISSQSTATQTRCNGGAFAAITVTATGDGLSYQWFSNLSNSNSGGTSLGTDNGAQTNSYTPQSTATGTIYYYCVVTGTCGIATTEVSGQFTVNALPTPSISGTLAFCAGSSTTLDAGSYSGYLWSTGATTQTISVSSAGSYTVTVTNANACSAISAAVTTVVNALPTPSISGTLAFCAGSSTTLDAGSYSGYLWSTGATTQTISVSSAGNYTVTVTNANGCSATSAAVTTVVNALPTPSISGTLAFCAGSSTTLDAGSYSGYLWSTGATTQTISVSSAGSYTVTVTNANGCSAASAQVVTVVKALPTPSISGTLAFYAGSSTTLDAGSYSSYLWSTGATTQTISVSVAGSYTVTVTNASGCSATSAAVTTVVNALPAPTISSFTPTSAATGISVTITGANLNGATAVSFGGTAATSFTVDNATQITALVGDGASGSVSVTAPGGIAGMSGFTYYVPDATWTGATSSDWNTAANWNPNAVPVALANVIIPGTGSGLTNWPVVYEEPLTPAVCNGLTINAGGLLTIASGKALTVNGTLTNNAGNSGLLIESGASLIETTTGIAATVKRAIPANKWHLISSPVTDATSLLFKDYYLQNHTESTNAYTDILLTNIPLNVMQGYALYGNTSFPTAVYAGLLNAGHEYFSTTASTYSSPNGGWNLVGNPYPSSIDWNAAGWTKNNVNATTYCHITGASSDSWATFVAGTPGVGVNGGTQYIASGQGFFVQATAAGTLAMTDAVRVHNAGTFFKNSEEVVPNLVRLEVSGNSYKDEAVVRFMQEATAEFDGQYDAHKFYGDAAEAAQIYTTGSIPLSINSLPETSMVPVGVKAGVSGSYSLAATEINDLQIVMLEDTKTGIFTELAKNAYTFNFDTSENELRFKLHFSTLGIADNEAEAAKIYSYRKTVFVSLKAQVKGDIFIYNISGQVVDYRESVTGLVSISLDATGVYIVKVVTERGNIITKVFIN